MKKLLLIAVAILCAQALFATHNQAGEIIYKQLNETTVEASIITYTNLSSIPADRDTLNICWGDGICDIVGRVNGPGNNGEVVYNNIKKNIYTAVHTYAGIAAYTITMTDPNRNSGILNVDFPSSEQTPFVLSTDIVLLNPVLAEIAASPIFLDVPIGNAFLGESYIHIPNAYSPTGDSIAYELTTPMGVMNYVSLTSIAPGSDNNLSFNEETGALIWDAPQQEGLYTFAYYVKFYRGGEELGRIIRDVLIEVEEGPGVAPEVTLGNIGSNDEILEVSLGDTVRFVVTGLDEDETQTLELSVSCGLFDEAFNAPATFSTVTGTNPVTAAFEWVVKQEHVRVQPYTLVVMVNDDTPLRKKTNVAMVRFKIDLSTSLPAPLTNFGVRVFPNPIRTGYLNLDYSSDFVQFEKYMIYNTLGQVIKTGNLERENKRINVQNLNQGTYFLILAHDGKTFNAPFLIQ